MSTVFREQARAKVNLTLIVRGRRADGRHDLESLVAFAAVRDELTFAPRGKAFSIALRGPTAGAAGPDKDNLVLKAAGFAKAALPSIPFGTFNLLKRLPAQAGLGGGSADAAAALRLLARAGGVSSEDPRLFAVAEQVGADVPVCLVSRARTIRGFGERLAEPVELPRLPAVLVKPPVAAPTGEVFAALGLAPGQPLSDGDPAGALDIVSAGLATRQTEFLRWLAASRNDLEPPAICLAPAIGEALSVLRADPTCRLARMSGSGSTVFGIYETCQASTAAAKRILAARPTWWVKPTTLS